MTKKAIPKFGDNDNLISFLSVLLRGNLFPSNFMALVTYSGSFEFAFSATVDVSVDFCRPAG